MLTNRSLQIGVAEAAGEEEADFHVGLVHVPDAHAVVCHHCPHRVIPRVVELLLAQLQHLHSCRWLI